MLETSFGSIILNKNPKSQVPFERKEERQRDLDSSFGPISVICKI